MDVSFDTSTIDYKAISEAIDKLGTLKEKLQYYNDNYRTLFVTDNDFPFLSVKIIYHNDYTIYCACPNCKDLFSVSDFEVYRDFVNNQTDTIVKYFNETTDYKAKLEYYFKLIGSYYGQKTTLNFKYVPQNIDEVKEYYKLTEVKIDVTPQNETEFNIMLEFVKDKIINSDNDTKPKRTLIDANREMYNPKSFIFENRVSEISNFLELIADETDRKELIKKYLDKINLDKIFTDEVKKNPYTSASHIIEVLKITDKIIQKNSFENVIDKTNFRDAEHYLLALETIKFKKFLNSLNVSISEQNKIIFDNLPIQQKIEIRTTENKLRNQKILNEYYNSIKSSRYFESAVLDKENELYYIDAINKFTEYRNSQLDTNELLNSKLGILKPFNFQIKLILQSVVSCYKSVVEWKKTNNELHENNLHIRFSAKLDFTKNNIIPSILYNYDQNPDLAFRLNEYCLNGFDLMIAFIENSLMINIKKSPLFPQIQQLIEKYKDAVDVEKIKVLANPTANLLTNKEPQQTEVINNETNPHDTIFNDVTAFKFFEALHNIYKSNNRVLLANYSFIFYAMKTDLFIVCTGAEFITFLSKFYQIDIDKIDSRQSGTNKKTTLYNAKKELFYK